MLSKDLESTLNLAFKEARDKQHEFMTVEHLLLALLDNHAACLVLRACGADLDRLKKELSTFLDETTPILSEQEGRETQPTLGFQRVLQRAVFQVQSSGKKEVTGANVLVALFSEQESQAIYFLTRQNVTRLDIVNYISHGISKVPGMDEAEGGAAPSEEEGVSEVPSRSPLEAYATNLNQLARQGKLHDIIGRKDELRQMVRTLLRATKNNPLLVGDAGVGKTVLVEGLAVRIATGRVIDELSRKQIVELDLAQLIAGTKYRGEFEQHLTDIINAARHDPELILFIDEIHTLIGAGRAEGGLDAANMMKPALTSGALRCIGATTLDEYHRYIEKDAALERRFQPIVIKEPTLNEAFEILLGLRPKFEDHHNVVIEPEALRTAVDLSQRFLPDRRLPDKAIDLMDEACTHLRIQTISPGAAVQYAPPRVLDREQIATVLTQWTGLPVSELTDAARERAAHMPELLAHRVVGQDEAVAAVSRVVSASSIGLQFRKRPIGVFLFVGPTGVGKTELAKALAEFLFGSDDEIIRLDMSEYMQQHEAAKLIGAPPGYVGHDEGGQLTDQLRRKPYSVVLLDEVEKANARVFDMFLQLFDDGRLTDARGRTIDASSAVFIMTSNIGSDLYDSGQTIGFGASAQRDVKDTEVIRECKRFFRPEFLNRIDEIVVFKRLGKPTLRRIVDRLIQDFGRQLADRNIEVTLDDLALI